MTKTDAELKNIEDAIDADETLAEKKISALSEDLIRRVDDWMKIAVPQDADGDDVADAIYHAQIAALVVAAVLINRWKSKDVRMDELDRAKRKLEKLVERRNAAN